MIHISVVQFNKGACDVYKDHGFFFAVIFLKNALNPCWMLAVVLWGRVVQLAYCLAVGQMTVY
jgi:hypothetical protein